MADLGAMLGGYGSDDGSSEEQGNGGPGSPGVSAEAAGRGVQQLHIQDSPGSSGMEDEEALARNHSNHVMDGPSANPEPPPEGESPLMPMHGLEGDDVAMQADAASHILPPDIREPPPGEPHAELVKGTHHVYNIQMSTGQTIMGAFRGNRTWRNPVFLEKMVAHWGLDQYGSSFSPEVWDPRALPPEDYGTALEKEAEQLARRREEERARRTTLDFTHGGRQQPQQLQQQQQQQQQQGQQQGQTRAALSGAGVGAMALAAAESAREKAARMQADAAARLAAGGAKRPASREGKRGNRWDQ